MTSLSVGALRLWRCAGAGVCARTANATSLMVSRSIFSQSYLGGDRLAEKRDQYLRLATRS